MTALKMTALKLIAFDIDDLAIVSAHVQDAIIGGEQLVWQPRDGRFAMVMNRFDWAQAVENGGRELARRQAALRFERVRKVRSTGIALGDGAPAAPTKAEPLVLLTITFAQLSDDDPAGTVTLTFAGAAAIELDVECLEAELRDLGPVWKAQGQPHHPTGDDPQSSKS